ncbi:hypothetical protein I0C86_08990 [Plantactinospora sp. S1510]|uniref:Uncharacterized protein n=1 Tax=Plantactinospora alkalitolerans TaxID=2789879 RepID=A0ABS0GSE8_9ACTN|nr:hypothetical protein [Plantactinospora alkalitolerans]MBF9129116.1 hypothetical protein [Plantactinospora alkalitolerans]
MTPWWRRRPEWTGYAASGAACGYGVVLLVAVLTGRHSLVGLPGLAAPGAGILLVGSALAAATVRPWGRRISAPVLTVGLWTVAGLILPGSAMVLLNLIELVLTGSVHDPDGNSDWLTFAQRLGLATVAALFAAAAIRWRRRTSGGCPRCGRAHPPGLVDRRHPAPHPAPTVVRRIAYVGSVAWLPYASLHTLGAFGVPGIEGNGYRPTWYAAVAFWAGIGLAVFLLAGLVRPWGMVFPRWTLWLAGRRVPRFLPLTPVWLVAPTLALYGTGALVLIAAGVLDWHWDGVRGLLGVAAPLAFGGYGWALAVAAVSYQRRTLPFCVPGRFPQTPVAAPVGR